MKIVELTGRLFVRGGLLGFGSNKYSPTSARRGDGLGFIRIWATPPNRLVFWDGAPSPSVTSLLTLKKDKILIGLNNV